MESVDKLVAILRNMGNKAEKVIELIEAKSPELAKLIREKMFMFEDIEDLSITDISNIVRSVPRKTLTMALKGTNTDFRNKIYGAVSQRVAEIIKEDIEILGPVKLSEVEIARNEIMDTVSEMISSGKINIEDDIYV